MQRLCLLVRTHQRQRKLQCHVDVCACLLCSIMLEVKLQGLDLRKTACK